MNKLIQSSFVSLIYYYASYTLKETFMWVYVPVNILQIVVFGMSFGFFFFYSDKSFHNIYLLVLSLQIKSLVTIREIRIHLCFACKKRRCKLKPHIRLTVQSIHFSFKIYYSQQVDQMKKENRLEI